MYSDIDVIYEGFATTTATAPTIKPKTFRTESAHSMHETIRWCALLVVFENSAVLDHWILVKLKKTTIFQLSSYRAFDRFLVNAAFHPVLFLCACMPFSLSSFTSIRFGIFHLFGTECLLCDIYLAQSRWLYSSLVARLQDCRRIESGYIKIIQDIVQKLWVFRWTMVE